MHRYSILVVEDDAVTRTTLQHFLTSMGHLITGMVSSAEECFEHLEAAGPDRTDLVLMDIMLDGEMDGREAAVRVASEYNLPVIFLTGLSPEDVIGDHDTPAACYIHKPVHKSELAANIQLTVRNHRMEQELRESEHRYRSLFDNAVAGIYQATPEGRVIDANSSFARILGYDSAAEAVESLRDLGVQYYDEAGRWSKIVQRLEREGELVREQSAVLGRDGDLIWVSEHLRAIPDGQGNIACIVAVVLDITERKEAEENMRLTTNLLHQTVDSLPVPLVLTDLDSNIILHNQPFADCYCNNGSLESLNLADVLPKALHAQCAQAFSRFLASSGQALTVEATDDVPAVTVSPYRDAEDQLIGALVIIRNPVLET
ncbi:PAS domain S-box protein [Oceanidesulfovibrio marinus]|nr:PAS domain S-box protein [Oceanidesulfovibrio marinus]